MREKFWRFVAFSWILVFLWAANALADPVVTLLWVPPTERIDGTPLAPGEISEYRVYHAFNSPNGIVAGQNYVSVTEESASSFDLNLVPSSEPYVVYFAVTAVDRRGLESDIRLASPRKFYVDSTAAASPPSSVTFEIRCGDACVVRDVIE